MKVSINALLSRRTLLFPSCTVQYMDSSPNHQVADLGWSHVGFGLSFIAFNSVISQALHLQIGASLVFAALRCVVQLTLVAAILQQVFAAENFWAVVGIARK